MAENIVKIKFEPEGDKGLVNAIKSLDEATKKLLNTQVKIIDSNNKNTRSTKRQSDGMRRLFIQLKANNKSFKDLGLSTSVLTKAFKGNRIALEKVRIAIKKLKQEQEKADVTTRILGGTFAVLRSKLLLVGFALTTVIRPLARIVGESAKIKDLSTAFATLSGGTNSASVAIKKLEDATNGTMNQVELFTQANNAMILGVTKNSDEMAEMFDMAQRLGEALGRDTTSSVESLITGIGRQSRLMLDNIGIIVDSKKAYEDYAKQLKKNTEQLTDSEKKQAFLNATLESARLKVKGLPPEVETASKIFQTFSSQLNDLGASLGTTLTPLAVSLTKLFTSLVKGIDAGVDALNAFFGLEDDNRTIEGVNIQLERLQNELLDLRSVDIKGGMLDGLGGSIREQKIQKEIDNLNKVKESLQKLAEARKEAEEKKDDTESRQAESRLQSQENELNILQQRLQFIKNASKFEKENLTIDQKRKLLLLENIKINEDQKAGIISEFDARKKILQLLIKGAELDKEEEKRKVDNAIKNSESLISSFSFVTDQFKEELASRENAELETLRNTDKFKNASSEEQKNMEKSITSQFAQEKLKIFNMEKTANIASIITNTASAVAEALPNVPLSVLIAGLGAIQLKTAMAVKPPQFQSGGLVGGRSHSQGGTLIEAERGEFVMSRNAVQSIGVEAMNQINQGNTGGLTLNVSAPLVDETVLDSIIPAIEKAQRMNLA